VSVEDTDNLCKQTFLSGQHYRHILNFWVRQTAMQYSSLRCRLPVFISSSSYIRNRPLEYKSP